MKRKILSSFTRKFIPNLEASILLEYFLISAVSSLLMIRAYLALTGYPHIGGGGFHIAHMLWGGMFMFVAIGLLLSFINSEAKTTAVVLGGIGFGTFIDELGKFITADNNYFYQPTVAIIYVIFVLVFLILKTLSQKSTYSSKTYVVNAAESIKELLIDDLNYDEKERAIRYLKKADMNEPFVDMLMQMLQRTKPQRTKFSFYNYFKIRFLRWYTKAIHFKIIAKFFVALFIVISIISLTLSFIGIAFASLMHISVSDYGQFASNILAGVFTVFGVYNYFKKKFLSSYQYLLKAAITSILLSQFFLFLKNEFLALINLAFFITVYTILRFTIRAEENRNVRSS